MSSIRVNHSKMVRLYGSQGGSIAIKPIGSKHKTAKSETMNQNECLAPEPKRGSGISELQNSLANLNFIDNTDRPEAVKLPGSRKRNVSFIF